MTPADLDRLDELRSKATPGPWEARGDRRSLIMYGRLTEIARTSYSSNRLTANAAYLAALDPATVGELIGLARIGLRIKAGAEKLAESFQDLSE